MKHKPTNLFAKIENMDGEIMTLSGSNPLVGTHAHVYNIYLSLTFVRLLYI